MISRILFVSARADAAIRGLKTTITGALPSPSSVTLGLRAAVALALVASFPASAASETPAGHCQHPVATQFSVTSGTAQVTYQVIACNDAPAQVTHAPLPVIGSTAPAISLIHLETAPAD